VARGPRGQVRRGNRLNIDSGIGPGWSVVAAVGLEGVGAENPPPRVEIQIPIENGRLAPEKARVPAGWSVTAIPR
jgi:hypothetical protein